MYLSILASPSLVYFAYFVQQLIESYFRVLLHYLSLALYYLCKGLFRKITTAIFIEESSCLDFQEHIGFQRCLNSKIFRLLLFSDFPALPFFSF